MITFINKKSTPVLVDINNEKIIISNNGEYKYNTNASTIEFIVQDGDKTKNGFWGYIFLVFLGLIGMLLDFADSLYLHFRNSLVLPVKVNLSSIDRDVIVEIADTNQNLYFCNVNANAVLNTELVINNDEIDNQYKAYQKECFAVFFIPILLAIALCVFIIISKNAVAYIALVITIAIFFYAWFSNHKRNKKYIESIKKSNH